MRFAVSKTLSGCEAMTMIPGTVGALPIQNVGASVKRLLIFKRR